MAEERPASVKNLTRMAATASCIVSAYVTTANGEAGEASSSIFSFLLSQADPAGSVTRDYKACKCAQRCGLPGSPTLVSGKKENTIRSVQALTSHAALQGREGNEMIHRGGRPDY